MTNSPLHLLLGPNKCFLISELNILPTNRGVYSLLVRRSGCTDLTALRGFGGLVYLSDRVCAAGPGRRGAYDVSVPSVSLKVSNSSCSCILTSKRSRASLV